MAGNETLRALSNGLADAIEAAAPGIVTVDARRRFAATGIVVAADAVLTASHVLERDTITVVTPGGERLAARLAGRDPGTDAAVLKVEGGALTTAARATATARVGELVLALGRPGNDVRASLGIINRVGGSWRTFRGGSVDSFVQSDVVMLPGFSGGPLVNVAGELVAMNSSHLGRDSGMAIPLAALDPIIEQLLSQGRIRRAYLGIGTQSARLPGALSAKIDGQDSGLLISSIEPQSPADEGGLLMGDILVRFADTALDSAEALQSVLGGDRVGKASPVTVLRGGEPLTLEVTPTERGS